MSTVAALMARLAALALLAGCAATSASEMATDALSGAQARCEKARAIYASLPEPTTQHRALVLATCADLIL